MSPLAPPSVAVVTLVGADVFIRAEALPTVPTQVGPLTLRWIGNRGTTIWPGEPPDILLVDLFRCRYQVEEGSHCTSADVRELLAQIEHPAQHWVHVEKLILINGIAAFSAT